MAKLITPVARLSFPHVFRRQEGDMGAGKYAATLLFPKDTDLSALKAAAAACIKVKWGDKKPSNLRSPFRDGDEKELDGYAGCIYIRATSKTKPGVVDANVQPILDEEELYPGCYVRASLSVYAYDQSGNKGVSFGLLNLQKVKDGDSFSSTSKAEDDFSPLESAKSSGASSDDLGF